MNMNVVACHGWGLDPGYFSAFAKKLHQRYGKAPILWDLGYFAKKAPANTVPSGPLLLVGHSLGLIKLLAHSNINIKQVLGFVGLQSFFNFLGNDPNLNKIRGKFLTKLKNNFIEDGQNTLNQFLKTCSIEKDILIRKGNAPFNKKKLLADLKLLMSPYRPSPDIMDMPKLIISASHDPIVPQRLVFDNFQGIPRTKITIKRCSGHNIGAEGVDFVVKEIIKFANEL